MSKSKAQQTSTRMKPSKMNRTGIAASPSDGKKMVQGVQEAAAPANGKSSFVQFRTHNFQNGETVGTVPPPASLKGIVKTVMEVIEGNKPTAFIDKVAERLAFERSGTRLYETLLAKFDAKGAYDGGPRREDLEHFCQEEAEHFALLKECMEKLGADPTAMTPSADLAAVQSMGVMQVVSDPRTDVGESLHAVLTAELVDNDGWELLCKLADQIGQTDMADMFRTALEEEEEHLSSVRKWVEAYDSSAVAREL